MRTYDKTLLFLLPLFLVAITPSFNICAQPFGILSPQGKQESQKQVLSSPRGRFVFGQISDSSKDQFMLDTLTGCLWRISERGDIGKFLRSVPYCNSEGKCSVLPEKIIDPRHKKIEKP